jgi:hypothetical protein
MIRLCAWFPAVGVLFLFPVACACVEACVAYTGVCVGHVKQWFNCTNNFVDCEINKIVLHNVTRQYNTPSVV